MTEFEGEDLVVCVACGTQYDVTDPKELSGCKICEDPRQSVPKTGQAWTSLRKERGKHKNVWKQDPHTEHIYALYADPKLGIGERAFLIKTPHGNIIWDLFAYIDTELVDFIKSQGPVKAIIISHPHFYTTHLLWSTLLSAPVYTHALDEEWFVRPDPNNRRHLLTSDVTEILPGVTIARTGGHFPGSLVLCYDNMLFHADSILYVSSAGTPGGPREGMNSFAFQWSILNNQPLGPEEVWGVWKAIKPLEFEATYGLMEGHEVRGEDCKKRVLDSAKIQMRRMGWVQHEIMQEEV